MMKLRNSPLVVKNLKSIKEFIAEEDNEEKVLETVQEIYRMINRYQWKNKNICLWRYI